MIHKVRRVAPISRVELSPRTNAVPLPDTPRVTLPPFATIVAESSPFVFSVLGKLGVPEDDVPDVCQEVFIVIHRRLPDFDGRAALRTWIYGICAKTASTHRRRRATRRELPTYPLPDTAASALLDESLDHERAKTRLAAVLATLDDEKRAVFVLYELEELPMSEVAVALNCPLQTAYSRLHAARKAVIAAFRRDIASEGSR